MRCRCWILGLYCFCLLAIGLPVRAEDPRWAWVKGPKDYELLPAYGQQNVPAPENNTGLRSGTATWTDRQGRLWLFGGELTNSNEISYLNDLWRYDPASGQWTWVKGSDQPNQPGIYGAQGTTAEVNTPGARAYAATWIDAQDRLWLYGGQGLDDRHNTISYGDLWRYDPAANQWTWVKGTDQFDQPPVFGTQGVAAETNTPGVDNVVVAWTDRQGRFWILGRIGASLWRFDPATLQWTWVKGSKLQFQSPVYGTQGVAAEANTPGTRSNCVTWTDAQGQFWLYGGGYHHSDLWRYDPATNLWTWLKSSKQPVEAPVYGTKGVAAPDNSPGTRLGSAAWSDAQGRFYLFGGYMDITPVGTSNWVYGYRNDLWRLDPATGQWTWLNGSDQFDPVVVNGTDLSTAESNSPIGGSSATVWSDAQGGCWLQGGSSSYSFDPRMAGEQNILWHYDSGMNQWTSVWQPPHITRYGMQGVPTLTNTPGTRQGAAIWTDAQGRFWLFGGAIRVQSSLWYYDRLIALSDLWRFDPDLKQWTWVKGSQLPNQAITFWPPSGPIETYAPGARWGAATWIDAQGRLWLYGGRKDGLEYGGNFQSFGDLWRFDPVTGV